MKDPMVLERRLCVAAFVVCAALSVWFSGHGWRNNILEGHEFRQAQTAMSVEYLLRDGWSLAYPLPLFGPPWSAPMEFPIFEVCAAAFARCSGLAVEPSSRLVSLAFFYLALPALFLLLRNVPQPPHRRWLWLAGILVSPLYLFYSRTVMIESTALCLSAWFLLAYVRALDRGHGGWLAAAIGFGTAAGLAKVTTYMVILVVAATYTMWRLAGAWRQPAGRWTSLGRLAWRGLAATIPSVVIGTAWVRYSDAIKLSNPLSEFLASGPLQEFTFGTVAQRTSPGFWWRIVGIAGESVMPPVLVAAAFASGIMCGRTYRKAALLLLAGFFAGPMLFANLYFVHDYYFYATGLFLVGLLALGWSRLLDLRVLPAAVSWLVIAACLGWEVHAFTHSYNLIQAPTRPEPPELARVLAATTAPDDVVLIYGLEWNPVVPYFSGRRVIMVANRYLQDHERRNAVIGRLPPGRITALVAYGDARQSEEFFRLLAKSLNLGERPVLVSATADIYLSDRLARGALPALAMVKAREFALAAPSAEVPGLTRRRLPLAEVPDPSVFDMMHPRPAEVIVPFGLSVSLMEGRRVFNAHSPTDVIFDLPAGARQLDADFGVLPDAYEKNPGPSGIRFLVELVDSSGHRTTLFEKYLDPRDEPADRGFHHLKVPLPGGSIARLVLRTTPGPKGNISYTWGFWSAVDLR
ncbi:MAG: hypothetical protein JSR48_02925 [Verrucomicrobia bacterium]|nr:hypothetical protein [Verrucomicrobiota bacterium]